MSLQSQGFQRQKRPPAPRSSGRVNLLAIDDRSSGIDLVLAQIFVSMRESIGWRPEEVAQSIGTSPDVIGHLEAGRIRSLPAWEETVRLIGAYGQLVRIDVRPILDRLYQQSPAQPVLARVTPAVGMDVPSQPLLARAGDPNYQQLPKILSRLAPAQPASAPPTAVRKSHTRGMTKAPAAKPRRLRTLRMAVVTVAAALIVGGTLLTMLPTALYASVDHLPPGIAKSFRSGLDRIALSLTPIRNGMKWIEVSDPRTRKSDRLPPATK